ncbi:hypothetical protein [Streptomyces sp. NBC_00996]|uniref:hypothetical protein n=1 Tax=Streptomyces sp. NBC_00996 TaxID=2903710 RepID=UPI00386B4DEE|nr:hypothetical protein OG390_01880 [Streptomyces sp. NBC_00996]
MLDIKMLKGGDIDAGPDGQTQRCCTPWDVISTCRSSTWSGPGAVVSLGTAQGAQESLPNVLAEGQREDLVQVLNKDLLLAQWPVLRLFVIRHLRGVREDAFPGLAQTVTPAT